MPPVPDPVHLAHRRGEHPGFASEESFSAHAGYARSFPDIEDDVRASRERILDSPCIPDKDRVRGFMFDVGRLTQVD